MKKFFIRLFFILFIIYAFVTIINQQILLNNYKNNQADLIAEIEEENQNQQDLINTKENANSKENVEKVAREKLGMYLPNERIYIDSGK